MIIQVPPCQAARAPVSDNHHQSKRRNVRSPLLRHSVEHMQRLRARDCETDLPCFEDWNSHLSLVAAAERCCSWWWLVVNHVHQILVRLMLKCHPLKLKFKEPPGNKQATKTNVHLQKFHPDIYQLLCVGHSSRISTSKPLTNFIPIWGKILDPSHHKTHAVEQS